MIYDNCSNIFRKLKQSLSCTGPNINQADGVRWHFYRENYRDIIPGGKEVRLLPRLLRIMALPCGTEDRAYAP